MTRHLFSSAGSRMWAVIALSTAALGTAVVLAQAPAADSHHDAVADQPRPADAGMTGARKMMADQKAMMAKMAADDQTLTDLLATMNAAKGEAKVAAIAAVVTELAAQRSRMQAQMMRMQGGMMDQMMANMTAMHGTGGMMKKAPAPENGATDADHAAHHPEK